MENFMKMEIKALLENVAAVRVAVSSFISNLDITIDELMDVKTAVSEAVTNAIEHGYYKILDDNSTVIVNMYISSNDYDEIKMSNWRDCKNLIDNIDNIKENVKE